jgi:hypothetical protein
MHKLIIVPAVAIILKWYYNFNPFFGPIPRIEIGKRYNVILNGLHFDELMQDTLEPYRPSSIILFHCGVDNEKLDWFKTVLFPPRSELMVGTYDIINNYRRGWFEMTPEMLLDVRFNATCGDIVFTSKDCSGDTEWCINADNTLGCDEFVESCTKREKFDNSTDFYEWMKSKIEKVNAKPGMTVFQQSAWLKRRDLTTNDNQIRNIVYPLEMPMFTDQGYKKVPIPDEMYNWLMGFYHRHKSKTKLEDWGGDATHINFDQHQTKMINLDMEFDKKQEFADNYIKPILEEWSGVELKQTAFYGIREYPDGSVLKPHIDREDTHVISATLSLAKIDEHGEPWPLTITRPDGKHVIDYHEAGTMIMYESARLIHGRFIRNNGGRHLGCFVHYTPKNGTWWREKVKYAKKEKGKIMKWD